MDITNGVATPNPSSASVQECSRCGEGHGRLDPDACLGLVPGVSHACCGHGLVEEAYVVIGGEPNESCQDREYGKDYVTLRESDALAFFDLMRVGPNWRAPLEESESPNAARKRAGLEEAPSGDG